jgi:hypothetical protein
MEKTLKQLIDSLDVKTDREDACSKADQMLEMDTSVLETLVRIGQATKIQETDPQKRKKNLRAIIFLIANYIKKRSVPIPAIKSFDVINFLYALSQQGFNSAEKALHEMDIFEADVLKDQLMSLPIVDPLDNDHDISVQEAIEEIKLSRTYSGRQGLQKNHYALGHDQKRSYEILRTSKNQFALRSKKKR